MWFKPYYGIEAERVGSDRGLCASAILSPEVCYLREAFGDFARWQVGLSRGSLCHRFVRTTRTAYASTPACCLIDREAPIWRRNAETLTKDGGAFCWIKWSYVEPQRKVAELERSRERLASNTSPLVGFEQFARFRQRRLELREQARFAGARPRHHGKRSDRVRPSRVRARAASRRVRAHVRQIFVKPRRAESWKWVRSGPRPVTS